MYKNRVKVSLDKLNEEHHSAKYMITNRVIGGSFIFGDKEKQHFLNLLFEGQERHAYRIIDYVILDNHYHCILEITPPEEMSRDEVFVKWIQSKLNVSVVDPGDDVLEAYKQKIHDLSFVVGNFEQRFVQWYNLRKGRLGSLFNRFDSVIIGDGHALVSLMAYIALNPVRAEMVTDPAEYHWCGYAHRLGKGSLTSHDIDLVSCVHHTLLLPKQIMQLPEKCQLELLWKYFRIRLLRAKPKDFHVNDGKINGKYCCDRTMEDKLIENGESLVLDKADHFMLKVRFATKGIAIGSEQFVEDVLTSCGQVLGYKRTHHSQPHNVWDHVHSLKKHRKAYI